MLLFSATTGSWPLTPPLSRIFPSWADGAIQPRTRRASECETCSTIPPDSFQTTHGGAGRHSCRSANFRSCCVRAHLLRGFPALPPSIPI